MFPLLIVDQRLVSAFVVGQGLLELILPMKYVANIVFEAGNPFAFAQASKNLSRLLRGRERAVVFTQKDQRLDGVAQGSRRFLPTATRRIDFISLVVVLHRGAIASASVERICFRSQCKRQVFRAAKSLRDQDHDFSKAQCLPRVHADFVDDQRGQLFDDFGAKQIAVTRKKLQAIRIVCKPHQLRQQFVEGKLLASHGHQSSPNSPSLRRSRSMHFCRVKPIEPTARPNSLATSL